MNMKTIAIDIRLIGKARTGDETVFFHLTKALLGLDHGEFQYKLLTDERDPVKLALLRGKLECVGQQNVEIVPLSFFGFSVRNRFLWNLFGVPLYLLQHHIDIYHTQYILPFFLPKRTRAVTVIHDVSFRAYPKFIAPSDRLFLGLFIPSSLKRATRVLAVSQFTKDEIVKYYQVPQEKISVIPTAPQDIFGTLAQGDVPSMRKKYGLPEQYFLYVGTLQPRKNIPVLLEAFVSVVERLPATRLVLVGNRKSHNVDPKIETTIKKLALSNKVIFPGYVAEKDLPLMMREAQAFVFPSLYEGFGIPLLEAMSQNVPVIASDLPSFRETGGAAFARVAVGDVALLGENMYNMSIVPEIRNGFIEAGKEQLALYSWSQSAKKLLSVYREM